MRSIMEKINYNEYASEYRQFRPGSSVVFAAITAGLFDKQINSILELGCGAGAYLGMLQNHYAKSKCFGIDNSEEMLSLAKENNSKLKLFHADANAPFPIEKQKFDLIYSVDFIHYINDLEVFYNNWKPFLSKKGVILTVTDSEEDLRGRTITEYFPETLEVEQKRYHQIDKITMSMKNAGFNDIKTTYTKYIHEFDESEMNKFRSRVFSCLRLIPDEAFEHGLKRLEKDYSLGNCRKKELYTYIWGS